MSQKIKIIIFFLIVFSLISCVQEQENRFENFITTNKNLLKDGDSTFRFLSFNIPNLNFVEDEMEFTKPHPFRLPTSFEIKDALESVKQLGGTVVRTYTFPVRRKIDTLDVPRYVLGPGVFDENSFLVMDTVLALANETGVRLILPFLNNWNWMGGAPQYAGFRNKKFEEFWTDSLLISDFKQTLNYVLNRTNTVTGQKYKDDKAILCWETGNELVCPYSWTKEIVTYIKSIDKNHLVMDGFHALDGVDIPAESIEDTLIDIVTTHQYKLNTNDILEDIHTQMERVGGKKPYLIGEYGFLGTSAIGKISDFIIENENIVGGLIWSLRHHREEGGYYWHSEPLGGGIYKAFHWPGFNSGIEYNEEQFFKMFRKKAYKIRGMEVPELKTPEPPVLLKIENVASISWKGSVGAKSYDVERSEAGNGSWKVIGLNISDATQTYTALFNDETAEIGKEYYYRIIAKNEIGSSDESNKVGPIKVEDKTIIDDMENLTVMYYQQGSMEIATDTDRDFKEIMSRMKAEIGSSLYYYVPGQIKNCKIFSFSKKDFSSLELSFSDDGEKFENMNSERNSFYVGKGDYDYWIPSLYEIELQDSTNSSQFLKVDVKELNQIARIEIKYIPFEDIKISKKTINSN